LIVGQAIVPAAAFQAAPGDQLLPTLNSAG
jgi:hypothetical protein